MKDNGGFIDLRLNRRDAQGNESFWPSFTDVMTVIMMIFLISMVVVLLRNMELVKEIRATVEAERQAMELARSTGEEKESIAARLDTALEQLSAADGRINELQLQVMRLQEQNSIRAKAVSDRDARLQMLLGERNDLAQQAAQLALDKQAATDAAVKARNRETLSRRQLTDLQQEYSHLKEQLDRQNLQIAMLKARLESQDQELARNLEQRQNVEQKYLVLADEYDNLKVRYDKLVRPARAAKGRHLVEVRYFKKGGKRHIEWRDAGRGEFKTVSRSRLDQELARLKSEQPDGLYIKVILPRDNGLSYSEAWKFTNDLHRKYDYYFQEAPPATENPSTGNSN
jgi:DNA repair exonuclease SbcCD ATPase subunit